MSAAGEDRMRMLLVSNSTSHGSGYLDHCMADVLDLLDGRDRLLFVPYALHDRDAYAARARARFAEVGVAVESLHAAADARAAIEQAEAVFVGGGNTFRLLDALARGDLLEPLATAVRAGVPYIGTSAGTNIACPTICTTNDMPIVEPPGFAALGLVEYQINAHYLDTSAPGHMGETREQRLEEFLEEQDVPVVGLREGSSLRVSPQKAVLLGTRHARLLRRGHEPVELPPGTDLVAVLHSSP